MSWPLLLQLLLWAGAALALSGAAAVVLARFSGAPAPVMPLQRLRGFDLPLAGVIFRALPLGLAAFLDGGPDGFGLPAQLALSLAGGLAAWTYLGLREGSFAPRRAPLSRRKLLAWRDVLVSYLVALPGFFAVTEFNRRLFLGLGGEEPVQGIASGWDQLAPLELAGVGVLAVLLLPLLEEALFRGYLWRWLAGRPEFGPRRAMALSAMVFALLHEPQAWLPILYLGGLFAWVYWRSGRLRYAVFAHALHNGLAAVLVLLPDATARHVLP